MADFVTRGRSPLPTPGSSLGAVAENRDPIDVAEEWVARALEGSQWEVRDNYPYEDGQKCWVERGVGENCERFIDTPLTSAEACVVEHMLNLMRGEPG